MIVDYKNLPETSKIYIYPASRKLYAKEVSIFIEKVKFVERFEITNKKKVIIAVHSADGPRSE